jgi:hypothetical protein
MGPFCVRVIEATSDSVPSTCWRRNGGSVTGGVGRHGAENSGRVRSFAAAKQAAHVHAHSAAPVCRALDPGPALCSPL